VDDEPKGWRQLQERAQRAKDPKKLAQIIDEMNRLLTAHEKAAAREEKPTSRSERDRPKQ
jgi:hypothetical protein